MQYWQESKISVERKWKNTRDFVHQKFQLWTWEFPVEIFVGLRSLKTMQQFYSWIFPWLPWLPLHIYIYTYTHHLFLEFSCSVYLGMFSFTVTVAGTRFNPWMPNQTNAIILVVTFIEKSTIPKVYVSFKHLSGQMEWYFTNLDFLK